MAKKSKNRKSKSVKKGASFSRGEFTLYMLAFALVGAFTLWVSFAAPHNSGGTKSGKYTGTLSEPVVVSDANSDGLANYGDVITFNVNSTAPQPYITLTCMVNGTQVYTGNAGFYASYPFTHYFTLSSSSWTSGGADCSANLHYSTTKGGVTMANLDFHVNP